MHSAEQQTAGARDKAKLSNIPVSLRTDLYLPTDRHLPTPSHPRIRGRSRHVEGLKGSQTTFRSRQLFRAWQNYLRLFYYVWRSFFPRLRPLDLEDRTPPMIEQPQNAVTSHYHGKLCLLQSHEWEARHEQVTNYYFSGVWHGDFHPVSFAPCFAGFQLKMLIIHF